MRLLVANEPRAYREALAGAIAELRPRVEVRQADSEALEAALKDFQPHMVLCSRLPEELPSGPQGWVELYPGGTEWSTFILGGDRITVPEIQLIDLLWMVDEIDDPGARLGKENSG